MLTAGKLPLQGMYRHALGNEGRSRPCTPGGPASPETVEKQNGSANQRDVATRIFSTKMYLYCPEDGIFVVDHGSS
jgi:hypothetical protein